MTFIDMFCGIGTIRMGMEQAGHECVYSIEWDKWKRKIYSIIFGGEPEGADITTIHANKLPRVDCWCFGAPCQDFSIAGQRKGLKGDRSSLVREVFRLLRETKEEYRPKYLFYENVKGMLSSNKGFDFLEILIEMESLGYDIEWQLLNSKDFGVSQNRERVFTIGHLRGRDTRKVFPIRGNSETLGIKVIGTTKSATAQGTNCRSWVHDTNGIVGALTSTDYKQPKQIIVKGNLDLPGCYEQVCRVYGTEGLSPSLTKCEGGGHETKILVRACLTPDRLEKRQNGRRFKEDGEPMFTLTKQDVHGVWIKEATRQGYSEAYEGDSINLAFPESKTRRGRVGNGVAQTLDQSCNQGTLSQGRIRKLTPKECWRLQGVPDEITDKVIAVGISDTQMYRGAGDATTVNVIYEIAKRMGVRS